MKVDRPLSDSLDGVDDTFWAISGISTGSIHAVL